MAKNNTGKIILWTVVMILGLTLFIIGGMFGFLSVTDSPMYYPWLGFIVGAGFSIYSIQRIVYYNNAWKEEIKDKILSDESELITHWQYAPIIWSSFAKAEVKRKTRWTPYIIVFMLAIIFLSFGLVMWIEDNFDFTFFSTLTLLFTLIAVGLQYLINLNSQMLKKAYLASPQPEAHLHVLGVLINRAWLIPFKGIGLHLEKVVNESKYGQNCLKFSVRHSGGDTDAVHEYYIPIPSDESAKVPLILAAYAKVIDQE